MTELARYEAARTALIEASTLEEVKEIADRALALKLYARVAQDKELECAIALLRLDAERKMGVLIGELAKASPGPAAELGPTNGTQPGKRDVLKELGISKTTAHRHEQLASVSDADYDAYIAAAADANEAVSSGQLRRKLLVPTRRQARIDELVQGNAALEAGEQRYHVILADPPWRYEHVRTETRAIENQYPTMDLDEICALPVQEIAHEHCVLFMWCTAPKAEEAFAVVNAWGFTYRTQRIWDKEQIGMGYWTRVQHEHLYIATCGNPPSPAEDRRPPSIIRAPRQAHSAKPEEVHLDIEYSHGELDRVELFARTQREGWASWGNQAHTDVEEEASVV